MKSSAGEESHWTDLFDALTNPYRRQLLVALLDHNPQDDDDTDPLNILTSGRKSDDLDMAISHTHLPKLERMGFIEWNKQTDEISKGPKWDETAPVLTLMAVTN